MRPAAAPPGLYVGPHVLELERADELTEEVFGPILHVVRYRADRLDEVIDHLAATGNVYVNRNMIGAVVGVQPFGGHGLSDTGPKAGGPHYLPRLAREQTLTINTAAAGGNAALLAQQDDD